MPESCRRDSVRTAIGVSGRERSLAAAIIPAFERPAPSARATRSRVQVVVRRPGAACALAVVGGNLPAVANG
jgi:hypothetical protein